MDPSHVVEIDIGRKKRRLFFGIGAFRLWRANKTLSVQSPREWIGKLSVTTDDLPDQEEVVQLLTILLMHDDKNISDKEVEALLDEEPHRYLEILLSAATAVGLGYKRLQPAGDDPLALGRAMGEQMKERLTSSG